MKVRPLGNRLVVQAEEIDTVSEGGIIIKDTDVDEPRKGLVTAVGKGVYNANGKLQEMDIAVGDIILFGKKAGTELKIDGEEILMLRDDEVLAVIT